MFLVKESFMKERFIKLKFIYVQLWIVYAEKSGVCIKIGNLRDWNKQKNSKVDHYKIGNVLSNIMHFAYFKHFVL